MKTKFLLITLVLVAFLSNLMATPEIFNKMELDGKVGVRYNFHSNDDNSYSDISVSNFDMNLAIEPFEKIAGYLGLIYNDGMEGLEVDEAYAKVKLMEEYSLALTAGNFYQPTSLALDYSSFITDPYTYTFTELSELAMMGEVTWRNYTFKTSIYNDDFADDGDSNLTSFVLNVSTEQEIEDINIVANGSYISNLIGDTIMLNDDGDPEMGAISLGTAINWSDFSFIGEYVMSLHEFNEEKPSVLYTELSYLLKNGITVAGKYSLSQNAQNFLNETAMGATINYTFMENDFSSASIGSEFMIESDYFENDVNTFIVKLSLDF